jgi:hypothetical protein
VYGSQCMRGSTGWVDLGGGGCHPLLSNFRGVHHRCRQRPFPRMLLYMLTLCFRACVLGVPCVSVFWGGGGVGVGRGAVWLQTFTSRLEGLHNIQSIPRPNIFQGVAYRGLASCGALLLSLHVWGGWGCSRADNRPKMCGYTPHVLCSDRGCHNMQHGASTRPVVVCHCDHAFDTSFCLLAVPVPPFPSPAGSHCPEQ